MSAAARVSQTIRIGTVYFKQRVPAMSYVQSGRCCARKKLASLQGNRGHICKSLRTVW